MTMALWARVWSPVVPTPLAHDAWRALGLPGDPEGMQPEFMSAFHFGAPAPRVPLLLHHTLNLPGDSTREDWMRVMAWLDLGFGGVRLPPDHLAIACEVIAVALGRGERVIVEELLRRYLLPWSSMAIDRLTSANHPLAAVAERFATDLRACGDTASASRVGGGIR